MNFLIKFILLASILVILFSCTKTEPEYFTPVFSKTPINLVEFNTEFDDYNSTAPSFGETFPLCFSTTRKSSGANFDIIYKLMTIEFSKKTRELRIYENTNGNLNVNIQNANINSALNRINTSFDELGPYLIPMGMNFNGTNINGRFETYIFLYSNNASGNQDIKFTQNIEVENYVSPLDIEFLNSEYDDAYPCFNSDNSEIYFTSNREGNFSFYKVKTDNTKEIMDILTNPSIQQVERDTLLSSVSDDKCPFISHDLMVFASNRAGGYGGFDLYYSRFANGKWGEPINFGAKINTEYDEYRPIVRPQEEFENDFMIYSSNRPEGKGGFDLYYVGIDKINLNP